VVFAALHRWLTAGDDDYVAATLQAEYGDEGIYSIATCQPGEPVNIVGTVHSVTVLPRNQIPRFEIQVYDGTGVMNVVWLGRRHMVAVEPGRRIAIHGRLTCTNDRPVVFNPRYELKPEHT
jgi:RecG-like helicase